MENILNLVSELSGAFIKIIWTIMTIAFFAQYGMDSIYFMMSIAICGFLYSVLPLGKFIVEVLNNIHKEV